MTGTKQTSHINFYNKTCTLSEDSVHPRSLINLCYLDEEAVYMTERVVETDQTVMMHRLIWIFIKHTD